MKQLRKAKESLRNVWRDIKSYLKYQHSCEDDDWLLKELREACDMATKYELIQKHYPNILARLETAAKRREQKLKLR